jgi:hypothetical protein
MVEIQALAKDRHLPFPRVHGLDLEGQQRVDASNEAAMLDLRSTRCLAWPHDCRMLPTVTLWSSTFRRRTGNGWSSGAIAAHIAL